MSPRERFKANKTLVAGFNDVVDSAQMTAAFDAAMLEYLSSLEKTDKIETSAANEWRKQGAMGFLMELKKLNSTTAPIERKQPGQLDHKV